MAYAYLYPTILNMSKKAKETENIYNMVYAYLLVVYATDKSMSKKIKKLKQSLTWHLPIL